MEENTKQQETGLQVLTLEERIQQDCKKFDVIGALDEIKKEYEGLTISGIDDLEGYEKVNTARKRVVKLRTGIEKIRTGLNEDALKYQRAVNDYAKKLAAKVAEIENPLEAEKLRIDNLKKEREEEEARKIEERRIQRARLLADHGMLFDGVNYGGHGFTIDMASVRDMADSEFGEIMNTVRISYQEEQAAATERERIRMEEEERQRKEREELEARRKELERQEEEAAERARKLAEEEQERLRKIEEEKRAELEERANIRRETLEALNVGIYQTGPVKNFVLSNDPEKITLLEATNENLNERIYTESSTQWTATINALKEAVAYRRRQMEEEAAEEEKRRQKEKEEAAAKAAAEAEERIRKQQEEEERKAKEAEEAKRKAAEEEAARLKKEEAMRPDREKIVKFCEELLVIELPEVKSPEAKAMVRALESALIELAGETKEAAKNL